jgi:hypothetical protein
MKIDDAIAMVNKASEEEIRGASNKELGLIYDHYVVKYYTGSSGEPLTPESFMEFWEFLTEKEKKSFIREIVL